MKIYPLHTYKYCNLSFRSSASVPTPQDRKTPKIPEFKPRSTSQEWLNRGLIALCVGFCVNNELGRSGFWIPDDIKRQEKLKTEYFEDVSKLKNSAARGHLYRFGDIENPEIISANKIFYKFKFKLDNENEIDLKLDLNSREENIIRGFLGKNRQTGMSFKAFFDEKNPENFKIVFRSPDSKSLIMGRKSDGSLYKIENGKKVVINRENVKKYEQYLKDIDAENDLSFFSNKNDLWRKLQIIFTIILLLNEMAYESLKKNYIKQNQKEKEKENK